MIVIPHLRNPASRNNTGKILPRLNPNLLKQVESLPLKSTVRERTRAARFLPPCLEMRACPHESISQLKGKTTSTSGKNWGKMNPRWVLDTARNDQEASCGRHGGRLSEWAGERRDYIEPSDGSTPAEFTQTMKEVQQHLHLPNRSCTPRSNSTTQRQLL